MRSGQGATGATGDQYFDTPSCSSEQSSAKKVIKSSLGNNNKKKPLAINIDAINELFTFGGEKGDFREETANANLENDIKELAAICVKAMKT